MKKRTAATAAEVPEGGAATTRAKRTRKRREPAVEVALPNVTREMRMLADRMLGSAAKAAGKRLRAVAGLRDDATSPLMQALGCARTLSAAANSLLSLAPRRAAPARWGKAGKLIRQLREQAGLSMQEVGRAVDLKDPDLLAAVEKGKVALPFEMVLRLAAVLGRKDPLTAALLLTRTTNPQIWRALEALGVGRLILQSTREREFMNILRAEDRARKLDDAEFAQLLAFVKASVGLALSFSERSRKRRP